MDADGRARGNEADTPVEEEHHRWHTDWPHGDPIKLTGGFSGDTLTFAGDSGGDDFTIQIDSTGRLQADGTMKGVLKAHFVDLNDAHEVARQTDQEISWTAVRGQHDDRR